MRKTPVVMGVLSMVFGGVQVLISGAGLASQPFAKQMIASMGKAMSNLPHKEGEPNLAQSFDRLARLTDELKVYAHLQAGAMLVLSIALLIVGSLLYKRRAQARALAVAWAIAALVYLPVQMVLQLKIIQPRTMEITQQLLASADPASAGFARSFAGMQGVLTVVVYVLFYAPFPLLLLWLIGRPSTKNDLLPAPPV
jgi:hypothetical protein